MTCAFADDSLLDFEAFVSLCAAGNHHDVCPKRFLEAYCSYMRNVDGMLAQLEITSRYL